jgi:hypothetical protein
MAYENRLDCNGQTRQNRSPREIILVQ